MTDTTERFDRDLTGWFMDGPERAPDGLLASAIDRARRTGQRSRRVAVALGAPTLDSQRSRRIRFPGVAIAWVVLLLVAVIAFALLAGGRTDHHLVVVPISTGATDTPNLTAPPRPSARPTVATVPPPTPTPRPQTVVWEDIRLVLPGDWQAVSQSGRLTIKSDLLGGLRLPGSTFDIVIAGPSGVEIRNPINQVSSSITVRGSSLEELAASAASALGLRVEAGRTTMGGRAAYAWYVQQTSYVGPLAWVAIVDSGSTLYVLSDHVLFDAPADGYVTTLLAGLSFESGT